MTGLWAEQWENQSARNHIRPVLLQEIIGYFVSDLTVFSNSSGLYAGIQASVGTKDYLTWY
jgi:hypothetical protein